MNEVREELLFGFRTTDDDSQTREYVLPIEPHIHQFYLSLITYFFSRTDCSSPVPTKKQRKSAATNAGGGTPTTGRGEESPYKIIKFGTNADLSDERKCENLNFTLKISSTKDVKVNKSFQSICQILLENTPHM